MLPPALLLAFVTGASQAQGISASTVPAFSFDEYVSKALFTSPELGQAEASLQEADYQWKSQTAAAWLPTVAFTGLAYPYGHNPAESYRYVHGRMNRDDMAFNTTVGLNLFNSFQDANRVSLARHGRNAARFARDASRRDRSISAARAYLDLGLRERLVEVARENLKGQDEQYRLTQDLYRNGMKSLTDLLKSETDWRSSELRITFADAERRRSLATFNSLIDREPEEPARLDPLPEPEERALSPLARDLEAAESRRPEVMRVFELESRADVARRQARRDVLPVFSVDATWNHQDVPTFGQPFTTPSAIPNPNYQLALKLSLPSRFNVVSQAEDWAAASAARRRAAQERLAVVRQVRLEAVQARITLEQALAAARIAAQKADLAGRNLELVTEQYKQGSADVIRLAQAQLDYLQARTERSQAAHDAAVSRLEYRRAIGEEPKP